MGVSVRCCGWQRCGGRGDVLAGFGEAHFGGEWAVVFRVVGKDLCENNFEVAVDLDLI